MIEEARNNLIEALTLFLRPLEPEEIERRGGSNRDSRVNRSNLPTWFTASLFLIASFTQAGQQAKMNTKSWTGVVINSGCTVDEAFAESDKCFERRGPGVKLSLYDDTLRQIYDLDGQDKAAPYFGDVVVVKGTLEDNTIRVGEIEKLTSIGLDVGQKAPLFSARDQFGREQTLETLRGPKGTALLFFRSADW